MTDKQRKGYGGKYLRVDLSSGRIESEQLDEETHRDYVGGSAYGAKVLYDEVPPGTGWSDPDNRLIWTTGPLAGTGVAGAATINIMAKGPMTNLAGSTQANGFMGAYMKFSGFDGVIFQGRADRLVYLVLRDGEATIKDAQHLKGKDVADAIENIQNLIR